MKVEDTRVEMANTAVSVRSYQSAERCSTAHSFYKGSVSSCSKLSACSRDENLTPRMFLDRYSLPRVVNIVPQEPVSVDSEEAGPMALLHGQLLMFRQYRSGKVEARSEVKTKHGSDLVSLVVIPDTYQGWFSVVTERGQVKARCYNSVHRLVTAQVTAFLCMSDIVGYTLNNRTSADGTRQQYTKTNIRSGQVLKLLAVYQDLANQSTRSKRLSWPLIGRTEANRYAQCLTSTDQVLYIPVTTHGQFYAIATANTTNDDTVSKVYQLNKLLRTFPLPVRVRIISMQKPQGSMLLETYKKEDVILTCILPSRDDETSSSQYRLLEIDVNSRFYVLRLGRRDSDERRVFQSPLVQNALRYCRENSDKWCRQLKVIHHIYPKEHLEKQEEKEKPTTKSRKISLGDKKTVKSASFRFSASMPEDLRPINRPLPRRPDQTSSRPQPTLRGEVEVHDNQHLYSNVAEEVEEPQSLRSQVVAEHQMVWATPINNTSPENSSTRKLVERTPPKRDTRVTPTPSISTRVTPTPSIGTRGTPTPSIGTRVTPTPSIGTRVTPTPSIGTRGTPTPSIGTRVTPTPSIGSIDERLSEEFKTKIVVHGVRVPGFDESNYADRNSKYRVVRKPVNAPEVRVKPFYKTRVQIGPDYSAGSDIPYSVVVDQVSTADDNVYAEIGDSYPTHDRRYFSFNYQRRLNHRYDYQTGGSDGTFSGTTTSSSNAEESSV
ncbi:uncharacterized protein LOC128995906 [Macrosteles quadrilineatus]|uniref:uncharacterized protein LOC128995906 n=1 Tax=Macrosteles quadrilineatus TaxID=74068 RepID=UPI0023E0AB52|nr:uncharacterized protein LOC128995906 [Macrosteles quadrilineatus]